MQRTKNHTCFISSRDLTSILQTVYPTVLILLLGITCAGGSMLIVFLCWRKIIQAQRGCVSRKTISMQKDLMISLGIQVGNFRFLEEMLLKFKTIFWSLKMLFKSLKMSFDV